MTGDEAMQGDKRGIARLAAGEKGVLCVKTGGKCKKNALLFIFLW